MSATDINARRDKVIQIRVNEAEKTVIERNADKAGLDTSEWIREQSLQPPAPAPEPSRKDRPPPMTATPRTWKR